jgi:hypothetical protein
MRLIVQVEAKVQWHAQRDRASGWWVAACPALNLTTTAKTWAELHESSAEALDMLMHEMLNSGDLDTFLRDHGWKLATTIPDRPKKAQMRFDVPFRMNERKARDASQAVLC